MTASRPCVPFPSLALATLAVACSSDGDATVLQDPQGKLRVVHQVEAGGKGDAARAGMVAALDHHAQIDLVFAHDDEMAFAASQACRQKGRAGTKVLGVGAMPGKGLSYVADGALEATFLYPTGAAAAIDLTLLACSGITPPRRLLLGTRTFTKANLAAGGTLSPAPGEFVLETLRRQHGDVLTTTPTIDVVFRIAMVQSTDGDGWRALLRDEAKAAAKRYPQIQFDYRCADGDAEKLGGLVREFVAQNYNAILVSADEPSALASVCKEAMAQNIKVVVLGRELGTDDFTCFVGADCLAIGRAAAATVETLLPNGGNLVEIQGPMTASSAQDLHRGFVEALGLRKKP